MSASAMLSAEKAKGLQCDSECSECLVFGASIYDGKSVFISHKCEYVVVILDDSHVGIGGAGDEKKAWGIEIWRWFSPPLSQEIQTRFYLVSSEAHETRVFCELSERQLSVQSTHGLDGAHELLVELVSPGDHHNCNTINQHACYNALYQGAMGSLIDTMVPIMSWMRAVLES